MKRDLSKSFKNDTYSDEELLKLSQKCADMSHSDIVSNLNSTITQQLSHDMNHGYYVPKEIGTEKVYVCCTMSHPKEVKFTTVPRGMLRGEKIPLEKPCLSDLDVPFSDFDRITPDEASGRGLSFKDFDRGIDFSKPTGPIDLTRSLNFGTLSSSSKSSFKPSKMSFGPDIDPDFFLPILKRFIIYIWVIILSSTIRGK